MDDEFGGLYGKEDQVISSDSAPGMEADVGLIAVEVEGNDDLGGGEDEEEDTDLAVVEDGLQNVKSGLSLGAPGSNLVSHPPPGGVEINDDDEDEDEEELYGQLFGGGVGGRVQDTSRGAENGTIGYVVERGSGYVGGNALDDFDDGLEDDMYGDYGGGGEDGEYGGGEEDEDNGFPRQNTEQLDVNAEEDEEDDESSDDDLDILLNDGVNKEPRPSRRASYEVAHTEEQDGDGEESEGELIIVTDEQGYAPRVYSEDQEQLADEVRGQRPGGEASATGDAVDIGEDGGAPYIGTGGARHGARAGYVPAYVPRQFQYVRPSASGAPGVVQSSGDAAIDNARPSGPGAVSSGGPGPKQVSTAPVRVDGVGRSSGAVGKVSAPGWNTSVPEYNLAPTKMAFDLDLDSLEEKPWRRPGADITDFFNYGLNETTWKQYCASLAQMRLESAMQNKSRVVEGTRADQVKDSEPSQDQKESTKVVLNGLKQEVPLPNGTVAAPSVDAFPVHVAGAQANVSDGGDGSAKPATVLTIPMGRPIQVYSEGSRLPSEMRRARPRDSSDIIEIQLEGLEEFEAKEREVATEAAAEAGITPVEEDRHMKATLENHIGPLPEEREEKETNKVREESEPAEERVVAEVPRVSPRPLQRRTPPPQPQPAPPPQPQPAEERKVDGNGGKSAGLGAPPRVGIWRESGGSLLPTDRGRGRMWQRGPTPMMAPLIDMPPIRPAGLPLFPPGPVFGGLPGVRPPLDRASVPMRGRGLLVPRPGMPVMGSMDMYPPTLGRAPYPDMTRLPMPGLGGEWDVSLSKAPEDWGMYPGTQRARGAAVTNNVRVLDVEARRRIAESADHSGSSHEEEEDRRSTRPMPSPLRMRRQLEFIDVEEELPPGVRPPPRERPPPPHLQSRERVTDDRSQALRERVLDERLVVREREREYVDASNERLLRKDRVMDDRSAAARERGREDWEGAGAVRKREQLDERTLLVRDMDIRERHVVNDLNKPGAGARDRRGGPPRSDEADTFRRPQTYTDDDYGSGKDRDGMYYAQRHDDYVERREVVREELIEPTAYQRDEYGGRRAVRGDEDVRSGYASGYMKEQERAVRLREKEVMKGGRAVSEDVEYGISRGVRGMADRGREFPRLKGVEGRGDIYAREEGGTARGERGRDERLERGEDRLDGRRYDDEWGVKREERGSRREEQGGSHYEDLRGERRDERGAVTREEEWRDKREELGGRREEEERRDRRVDRGERREEERLPARRDVDRRGRREEERGPRYDLEKGVKSDMRRGVEQLETREVYKGREKVTEREYMPKREYVDGREGARDRGADSRRGVEYIEVRDGGREKREKVVEREVEGSRRAVGEYGDVQRSREKVKEREIRGREYVDGRDGTRRVGEREEAEGKKMEEYYDGREGQWVRDKLTEREGERTGRGRGESEEAGRWGRGGERVSDRVSERENVAWTSQQREVGVKSERKGKEEGKRMQEKRRRDDRFESEGVVRREENEEKKVKVQEDRSAMEGEGRRHSKRHHNEGKGDRDEAQEGGRVKGEGKRRKSHVVVADDEKAADDAGGSRKEKSKHRHHKHKKGMV